MTDNQHEKYSLAPTLKVGNTVLNIKDLEKLKQFYASGVGLEVLQNDTNEIVLGNKQTKILTLSITPELPLASLNEAGLYHNAIVFRTRAHLAHTIQRLFRDYPRTFIGSADHFVSEAFYFVDPEGNELELYFDRDRSTWEWENGRVSMGSVYIDPEEYINTYAAGEQDNEKHMGHVHLKVGDITTAKHFYVDTLGFDITAEMPQALFISVGGYHHHIGMNSWQSLGASPRQETLGLQSLSLQLPSKHLVDALATRLEDNHMQIKLDKDTLIFPDPWNNYLRVTHES